MAELSTGVRTLLARMESNPEEFYGEADKWRFMFSPNFREVMTEPEKGALHEALAEVRRKEFDERVMRRLLQDDMDEQARDARSRYGAAISQLKGQNQAIFGSNMSARMIDGLDHPTSFTSNVTNNPYAG